MSENSKIHYNKRTFSEYRDELYSYVRDYYPEVLNDFSDSSVGSVLIDINAGVSNNLSINTDRAFQETQLEYVQQRENLLEIAKNLGFNIPNKRPAVTVAEFSVLIPVKGDKPDESYYPILKSGSQITGGGVVFETMDVVDWNSPYSSMGEPNRAIIPNLDGNGIIQSYTVKKREVVVNGVTSVYKKTIRESDTTPFFKLTLQDNNVIDILDVALIEGTGVPEPDEVAYKDLNNRYHEVKYLAQQNVFVEDSNISNSNNFIKAAKWINITKKFIKEFDSNGFCSLIFGSGDTNLDVFKNGFIKAGVSNRYFLETYLNNTALGEKLKRNHTLFVRYRTGGGSVANVGINVLKDMGQFTLNLFGEDSNLRNNVKRSLKVTNPIPAFGGNDGLSIEEIRYLIKYNFSSQDRCVTLNDYLFKVFTIPGKFGSPFRANAFKENNKVVIPILSLNNQNKLSNTSNNILKNNIAEYLSNYRMINDYVEIRDGRIFNIGIDVYLFVRDGNDSIVVNDVINVIKKYFNIQNKQMNEDIMLNNLFNKIMDVEGVNNIIDLKIFNKVGGDYSINPIEQEILNETTGEIKIINNTIYSTQDSMFEIKYPEKDIRVFLKKRVNA